MENIELVTAIRLLKPNSQFSFTDNDYSTIKWDVLDGEAPTQAEIDAAIVKVKADKVKAEAKAKADKEALLAKLGITAEEAALLLS
jgi:hypothetical protein